MPQSNISSIAVVIPVKDRREELLRALRSVIDQSITVKEIFVVDDGSLIDIESEVREKFPEVVYLKNKKSMGAPFCRNLGWKNATAEYVAFLDSDDEWMPECLRRKLQFIKSNQLDFIVGSVTLDDGSERKAIPFKVNPSRPLRENLLGNNRFDARTSTFFLKTSMRLEILFDEKLRKHQDWDLFLNVDWRFNTGFTNDCDTIIHISKKNRISNKLNHPSTIYFLSKNFNLVSQNAFFMFLVKMLYRAERSSDQSGSKEYRNLLKRFDGRKLSFRNRILRLALRTRMISGTQIFKLSKQLGQR